MKKRLLLLGASGSIGQSALAVIRENSSLFTLIGVSVYNNHDCLRNLLQEFPSIKYAGARDVGGLKDEFPNVTFYDGKQIQEQLINEADCDLVINAIVGFAGLLPSLNAIKKGIPLALANKESLVVAGEIIINEATKRGVPIIPIDSEHSAIFQCLLGERKEDIAQVVLTCSGGSVRNIKESDYHQITPAIALKHPTWQMGSKITIDSATLVNKAFEVIEAHYLFGLPASKINVVLHEESIIHSLVYFKDGSVKAQMAISDMRIPTAFALGYPNRLKINAPKLELGNLHFASNLGYRQKMIDYGYKVVEQKGTYGVVFNAVNEVAVAEFLAGRLHFIDIFAIISKMMDNHENIKNPDIIDIIRLDQQVRKETLQLLEEKN